MEVRPFPSSGKQSTVYALDKKLSVPRKLCGWQRVKSSVRRGSRAYVIRYLTILNKVPPFATKLLSVHLFINITPHYMFRPTGRPSSRAI
jgi:hypothetical protein